MSSGIGNSVEQYGHGLTSAKTAREHFGHCFNVTGGRSFRVLVVFISAEGLPTAVVLEKARACCWTVTRGGVTARDREVEATSVRARVLTELLTDIFNWMVVIETDRRFQHDVLATLSPDSCAAAAIRLAIWRTYIPPLPRGFQKFKTQQPRLSCETNSSLPQCLNSLNCSSSCHRLILQRGILLSRT